MRCYTVVAVTLAAACVHLADAGRVLRRRRFGGPEAELGHLGDGGPKPPALTATLLKAANECSCSFRTVCTCERTMEFMDCMAEACATGRCACDAQLYHAACTDVQAMCNVEHSIDMQCIAETQFDGGSTVCTTETITTGSLFLARMQSYDIHTELTMMRDEKCKLEAEVQEGWTGSHNKLKDLRPKIDERARILARRGEPIPRLDCGPPPTVKPVEKAMTEPKSAARPLAAKLMSWFCAAASAWSLL